MEKLRIVGNTDTGKNRKDNQDKFICKYIWANKNIALLAAIDGVGGYYGGETAADIARASIETYMEKQNGEPLKMLEEAVVQANNSIYRERQKDFKFSNMCCVLTTAIVDTEKQKLHIVHVGDSRLYRFRAGVLEKLTKDHSLVGIREDENMISEEEAMNHPRRNEILRDVGSQIHKVDDIDFLDSATTDFLPQDIVLLCSDGLTDMLMQKQISEVLAEHSDLEIKVLKLIQLANEAGGKDNITIVLAKNESLVSATASKKITDAFSVKVLYPETEKTSARKQTNEKPVSEPESRKSKKNVWRLPLIIMLVAIIAAAVYVWSLNNPPKVTNSAQAVAVTTTVGSDTLSAKKTLINLDSLIVNAIKNKNKQLILSANELGDTLYLAQPVVIKDTFELIAKDKPIVILPVTVKADVAFVLEENTRFFLKNLIISRFSTGFSTKKNTEIRFQDVIFSQVNEKVSILVPKDTLKNESFIFK
ncbi:PP2C family protein-serine/threonine phosphatase [Emticicia sp. 17c]|uniref:PP2C family protein-serine/threonine phosphatase n=1 Tax=Emticicia sp. 17c TaxID=3127704 RepID=UPI00301C9D05